VHRRDDLVSDLKRQALEARARRQGSGA